jgi:multidrug efflux pump subunit AcrB
MTLTPFRTVTIFAFIFLAGLVVCTTLDVSLGEKSNGPMLVVSFDVEEASPETVESLATEVIENALSGIRHLKSISSQSSFGNGSVSLEFDSDTDMEFKKVEIVQMVRRLYSNLNSAVSYPRVTFGSSEIRDTKPLMIYSVYGPGSNKDLASIVDKSVAAHIRSIPGVERVDISGMEDRQVRIDVDLQKLAQFKINLNAVKQLIFDRIRDFYPGMLKTIDNGQYLVKIGLDLNSIEALQNLRIQVGEQSLSISDIAKVRFVEGDARQYFRINGKNLVTLSVYSEEGAKEIALTQKIKAKINERASYFQDGYGAILEIDDSNFIIQEIYKSGLRLSITLSVLAFLILILFGSWRHYVCLLLALLSSISISVLVIYFFKVDVTLHTLAGITICIGIMTDNIIVAIDFLKSNSREDIPTSIIASTIITVVGAALLSLIPTNESGFEDLAIAILISLAASLVTSIILVPKLQGILVKSRNENSWSIVPIIWKIYRVLMIGFWKVRLLVVAGSILLFGLPFFLLPAEIEGFDLYNRVIGSSLYQKEIRPLTDKYLGGMLRPFIFSTRNSNPLKGNEKTVLHIDVVMPSDHSIDRINSLMRVIEGYLSEVKEIDRFVTSIQSAQGGKIQVTFDDPFEHTTFPEILKNEIIGISLKYGGVRWNIYGVGRGFSNARNDEIPKFRVKMKGYNYEELGRQAMRFAEKLKIHDRIQEVNTDGQLTYDQRVGRKYFLTPNLNSRMLSNIEYGQLVSGLGEQAEQMFPTSKVQIGADRYNLFIESGQAGAFTRWNLMNSAVDVRFGKGRLYQYADFTSERKSGTIFREDRQFIRVIEFQYFGARDFGKAYLNKCMQNMDGEMPPGYSIENLEWSWDSEVVAQQYILISYFLLTILVVCMIFLESFVFPVAILFTIIGSFTGLLYTFGVASIPFDEGGVLSFILLSGVVSSSAILVASDYLNREGPRGLCIEQLFNSVRRRSKTILMTCLTTCCSFIPFVFMGEYESFWYPLAIGSIVGCVTGIVYLFIMFPIVVMLATGSKNIDQNRKKQLVPLV